MPQTRRYLLGCGQTDADRAAMPPVDDVSMAVRKRPRAALQAWAAEKICRSAPAIVIMGRMDNDELLLFLLQRFPGLDDNELSRLSGLTPARRVKRVCRDLEGRQLLERKAGSNGRIVNYARDSGR